MKCPHAKEILLRAVSVFSVPPWCEAVLLNHRGTENTEIAQRKSRRRVFQAAALLVGSSSIYFRLP